MAGLLEKARTVVLSTAHGLLDRIIDLNSVGAVRQYVRDLEGALEDLRNAAAEAIGYARGLDRELTALNAQIAELDGNITLILTDDNPANDASATVLQVRLNGLTSQRDLKTQELVDANKTAEDLQKAVTVLQAKHTAMVQQLQQLEALDRAAKAKEQAAKTVRLAASITSSGADASVDNVAAGIRRRADVAGVKFDQAMEGVQDQAAKDVAIARAQAQIAERKAQLQSRDTAKVESPA